MLILSRKGLTLFSTTLTAAGRLYTTSRGRCTIAATAGPSSGKMVTPNRKAKTDVLPKFDPKRVLVLTKITRYEFEKQKYPHLDEEELANVLAKKGSNLKKLKELHDFHKDQARKIVQCLSERNIEACMVNRYEYSAEGIAWADAVFTAGGDGTFLLGASKLKDATKPMIGINTDPRRSEGYLCLSKRDSADVAASLDKLLSGRFKWFHRQRIRIELSGPHAMEAPVELHEQQLEFLEQRFSDHPTDDRPSNSSNSFSPFSQSSQFSSFSQKVEHSGRSEGSLESESFTRVLPECALNEVFLGESLSSLVSYYEIAVDDAPSAKQKSSGVTICTGTGSTSWSFNINKLTQQATASLIKIIRDTSLLPVPSDETYAELITKRFNDELIFDPSDSRMVYTVRDPVSNTTYSAANPRGLAQRVQIKSRCYDASLVIDGGPSYKFNEGAQAVLTIHPDDALLTVQLE